MSDFEGLFWLVKVIGDYPSVTLSKARQARDIAKGQLADGIAPIKVKQEHKRLRLEAKGKMFENIGGALLAKQRKEGRSAATLSKTEYHLKLAKSALGDYCADDPKDAAKG